MCEICFCRDAASKSSVKRDRMVQEPASPSTALEIFPINIKEVKGDEIT